MENTLSDPVLRQKVRGAQVVVFSVLPFQRVCVCVCVFSRRDVLSRVVSRQASLGVGRLPLLGEERHGLGRGAETLAGHLLMQRHPLRKTRSQVRVGKTRGRTQGRHFLLIRLQRMKNV